MHYAPALALPALGKALSLGRRRPYNAWQTKYTERHAEATQPQGKPASKTHVNVCVAHFGDLAPSRDERDQRGMEVCTDVVLQANL